MSMNTRHNEVKVTIRATGEVVENFKCQGNHLLLRKNLEDKYQSNWLDFDKYKIEIDVEIERYVPQYEDYDGE